MGDFLSDKMLIDLREILNDIISHFDAGDPTPDLERRARDMLLRLPDPSDED